MPQSPPSWTDRVPGPYWVDGEFWLELRGPEGDHLIHIPRPYAVVGRLEGSDVRIDDRRVSARHAYIHLDHRGLYAVDLASRTGTRFPEPNRLCGWISPGESLIIGGRRLRFIEAKFHDRPDDEVDDEERDDLLVAARPGRLARVFLYPQSDRGSPRSLDSELVFAGRGACCSIRVEGASVARVHAALIRTADAAYVVDLYGRNVSVEESPVAGVAMLHDDDVLGLGVARFRIQLEPTSSANLPRLRLGSVPAVIPDDDAGSELAPYGSDATTTQMTSMVMQLVHAGQAEALRRQDEFHLAMVKLVQQLQADNTAILTDHLARMEAIHREIASLREELVRRASAGEHPAAPTAPKLEAPPLRIASPTDISPPEMATDWLLDRVSRLEQESRSTWKDLLGRLGGQKQSAT